MKFKSLLFLFFISATLLSTVGCKKIEGPGGAATIKGVIHVQEYDGANNLINEYDAPKFDVYIIYGNEEGENYFDDDIETSFDGSFEFNYLEPGDYQIFVYEDCNTCLSGKEAKVLNVTIQDKKEDYDLGTINVFENF
ncbi:hypothetical protein OAU25_02090 [Crocinitomicaceae bacterium]|nr:hypothetical protein [Crocinitomicaceae bacterium]